MGCYSFSARPFSQPAYPLPKPPIQEKSDGDADNKSTTASQK
jgi:hypothetical protein